MKIIFGKWFKRILLALVSTVLLSNLSGCGLGLDKLEFHSTETVKNYLEDR